MVHESYESFLRSDINTEFIYIILLGIKHFFSMEPGTKLKYNKIVLKTENSMAKISYTKLSADNKSEDNMKVNEY
jgi:hypothetical protein